MQDQGPHIYQTCPSANYFDCKAMAIGARSQSARTYLEKHLNEFPSSELDDLIKHGLRALRDTLPTEADLSTKVCKNILLVLFQYNSAKIYKFKILITTFFNI